MKAYDGTCDCQHSWEEHRHPQDTCTQCRCTCFHNGDVFIGHIHMGRYGSCERDGCEYRFVTAEDRITYLKQEIARKDEALREIAGTCNCFADRYKQPHYNNCPRYSAAALCAARVLAPRPDHQEDAA